MEISKRNCSRQVINDHIRCRALLTTSELPIHPEIALATRGRRNENKQGKVTCDENYDSRSIRCKSESGEYIS